MNPDLLSGNGTLLDTQRVYTDRGLPVGTIGILPGRSYVWCSYKGSAGLTRGEPLVVAAQDQDSKNLATTTTALSVGSSRVDGITAGAAAISADAFADGLLAVVDGGGDGTQYAIDHHSAFTASTADGTVFLREDVKVAGDADTEVSFIENKYANPRQSQFFQSGTFVGVPNVTVPDGSSTTQYFWAQRNGYCPAFVKGTPKAGEAVVLSSETDGRFAPLDKDAELIESMTGGARHVITFNTATVLGVMVTDAIDGEIQLIDLQNPLY